MRPCAALAPILLLLLASGASADTPPAADPARLGAQVVPTFQAIELQVNADRPDYRGSTRIELEVREPTSSFRFHAQGLKLERLALEAGGRPVRVTWELSTPSMVTVTASETLEPGPCVLSIDFSNAFDTRAAGLYRLETGGHAYAFTQFEAVEARRAFPCWDEPSFKHPYQLTLTVPSGHLALTNMPIEGETPRGDARTVVFRRTPPLPSYLLAIATGPFDEVPIPGMSIPGNIITPRGQGAWAAEAVRLTPPLLAALERYFGRPYPFEKLDLVAVPEYWYGAMENPGAIVFVDRLLLADPQRVSVEQRRRMASVIAHELAHMWFGDLVTMAWWDDLWLNESFATWMGTRIVDEVYPGFQAGVGRLENVDGAMQIDARLSTRAIRQPVRSAENLTQLADALAYNKGMAVLGMFEQWLSPETFRRGVLGYLDAHAWGNASAADLWSALSRAAGRPVGTAMSTFLDQPGLPLVLAEPVEGNRVRLTQQRLLGAGIEAPQPALWQIPVTLRYSGGGSPRTTSVLLTEETQVVALPGVATVTWLHPNADELGYYRWSVPPEVMRSLAEHATSWLTPRERVGFVGNLAALLAAGAARGDEYLRLLAPFGADPEPRVVRAFIGSLEQVADPLVEPATEAAFAGYVRSTLGPALERIGLDPQADEPEAVALLRPDLMRWVAERGKDARVQAHADSLALRALAGEAVDPALADVALGLAARHGDRALFDACRHHFETAAQPADRLRYLEALGRFEDPALTDSALAYVFAGPLRPQEVVAIPRVVAEDRARRDRVFEWMTANYPAFARRLPAMRLIYLPGFAAGCSTDRLERARAFFADPAHSPPGTEKELAKTADAVNECAALSRREGQAAGAYLERLARSR
ncbi:MAG: hypothetical protein A2W00_14100 [Candidatus Eisenbacteria bacterium RBG_16_71_46]|nr:MAG: hypothetical protein A2W00_14100 [Candidatus Eisenbacteria bacterium RBG_16_71_46]